MKPYLPYRPYRPYLAGAAAGEAPEVTLVSIAVTPDAGTIADGATQQFTATGTYDDASEADITADVTWASSDEAIATITAGGLATGQGPGQATISATLGAVSGGTTLDVSAVPLFHDSLLDLAIDASGTPTRESTAYHQNQDGLWVPIASGAPRWKDATWTGSEWTGETTGLLMEPAAVNIAIQSNNLSDVAWTGFNVQPRVATTLLGLGANYLVPNGSSSTGHGVYKLSLAAGTVGQPYTAYVYVKASGYDAVLLAAVGSESGGYGATFNLTTGALHSKGANVVATSIVDMGDGIYRVALQAVGTGSPIAIRVYVGPSSNLADNGLFTAFVGDTTSGVIAGSVNIFNGTIAQIGSPIVTTTVEVARAVDALAYADVDADNETRLTIDGAPVDIDDWDGNVPVPTAPQVLSDVKWYAPGERPA